MGIKKKTIEVFECDCLRCEHHWTTHRNKKPQTCPECHMRNWDKPGKLASEKSPIYNRNIADQTNNTNESPTEKKDKIIVRLD